MALEDELPDDALQPLEQSELEAVSQSGASKHSGGGAIEELGDEAEIEPLPAEDTLAASSGHRFEPGLGIDEALAKRNGLRAGKFKH